MQNSAFIFLQVISRTEKYSMNHILQPASVGLSYTGIQQCFYVFRLKISFTTFITCIAFLFFSSIKCFGLCCIAFSKQLFYVKIVVFKSEVLFRFFKLRYFCTVHIF